MERNQKPEINAVNLMTHAIERGTLRGAYSAAEEAAIKAAALIAAQRDLKESGLGQGDDEPQSSG